MRAGWIWVVVVVAVAAVGWMLFGDAGTDDGGGTVDGTRPDDGEAAGGPALKGAGEGLAGVPRVPIAIRGLGTIQGVARRGGRAVPATVALRHVQELDPRNPFKGGVETMFVARLLDGGISSTTVIARVETEGDGAFVFRGLAPGLYEVRATAADGAIGLARAALPAAGARVEASVEIAEGGHTLAGRVRYADGTPFRGTALAVQGNSFAVVMGGGGRSVPAPTDAEGRFRLVGLAPGRHQISAILPGVLRVMGAPIEVPYEGEYELTIDAAGREVKGTVIDAETEEPIAGAFVFGGGGDMESSFAIFTTRSGPDGRFGLTLPAGRGGGMFVRADGYAVQMIDFDRGSAVDEMTVALLRLARLGGRVTTKAGGAPVAGTTVFAMGSSGRGMMPTPGAAVTDADGRYVLEGIDPGTVKVWAIGAGQASVGMTGTGLGDMATPYSAELEPGQEATLDLETVPAGRVEGHVLTEDGRPVPGAVVQAIGGSGMQPQLAAIFLGMGASWGTAVTDADGAYAIDVLAPGSSYKVMARAAEHPSAQSGSFVAVGGKTETLDLHLKSPRWLDVEVVGAESGAPVPGAVLMARPTGPDTMVVMEMIAGAPTWTTNAEGRARIGPLPEGAVKLHVKASRYIEHDETEIDADATGPVRVALTRGLVLAGRVELPAGVPMQVVRVTITRSGGDVGWFRETVAVKPDGSWQVDSLPAPGEYKVQAEGHAEERVFKADASVPAGLEDVVLRLVEDEREARETLTLTVLDADGKPVPTGRVQLWRLGPGGSTSTHRTTLSAGKARVRGFGTDGEIWVEVFDLVGRTRGAILQGPVTFVDGALEVRLGPSRSIGGRVLDAEGQPVTGAKVTATAVHPRTDIGRNGQEHGASVTDTDGRFEIHALGDLDYRVTVQPSADYRPIEPRTVHAGTSDLAFSATLGVRARIVVLDSDGQPIAGAFVWTQQLKADGSGVQGTRMWDASNRTDAAGTLTLRGLAGGARYKLTVNAPEGRSDLRNIEVAPWTPQDDTLRFERAYTIAGTVVDQHGKPAAGARIQHRKAGTEDWQGWTRTDAEGAFEVPQLEPGRYELKANPHGGGVIERVGPGSAPAAPEPGIVTARAGATGVRLTVDLGLVLTVTVQGGRAAQEGRRQASLVPTDRSSSPREGTWQGPSTIRFEGLREGVRYRLWVHGLEGGRYAVGEVVGGRSTLAVEARPGGVITGTVKRPPGVSLQGMHVGAANELGQQLAAPVDAEGRFRLEGIPHDTPFALNAFAWVAGGDRYRAEARASAGDDVVLELRKQ